MKKIKLQLVIVFCVFSLLNMADIGVEPSALASTDFNSIRLSVIGHYTKSKSNGGCFSDEEIQNDNYKLDLSSASSDQHPIVSDNQFLDTYFCLAAQFEKKLFSVLGFSAAGGNPSALIKKLQATLQAQFPDQVDTTIDLASTYRDQLNPGFGSGQMTVQSICGIELDGTGSGNFGHSMNGQLVLVYRAVFGPSTIDDQGIKHTPIIGSKSTKKILVCPKGLYAILTAADPTAEIASLLTEALR